jgi:hypothetical protein
MDTEFVVLNTLRNILNNGTVLEPLDARDSAVIQLYAVSLELLSPSWASLVQFLLVFSRVRSIRECDKVL